MFPWFAPELESARQHASDLERMPPEERQRVHLQESNEMLADLYDGLSEHFSDLDAFKAFYLGIPSEEVRQDFQVRIAFYLAMVKRGRWKVSPSNVDHLEDYLTDSHKLAALIALAEAESNTGKPPTFAMWMYRGQREMPSTPEEVTQLEAAFNKDHGKTRSLVRLFAFIPVHEQQDLFADVMVKGKPIDSIEKFVRILYARRSDLVHESVLFHSVLDEEVAPHQTSVRIGRVMRAFELAMIEKYRAKTAPL